MTQGALTGAESDIEPASKTIKKEGSENYVYLDRSSLSDRNSEIRRKLDKIGVFEMVNEYFMLEMSNLETSITDSRNVLPVNERIALTSKNNRKMELTLLLKAKGVDILNSFLTAEPQGSFSIDTLAEVKINGDLEEENVIDWVWYEEKPGKEVGKICMFVKHSLRKTFLERYNLKYVGEGLVIEIRKQD